MGKFEVDRFVTAPDPDLICCVCYCVLDNPLESPCQHVYCKICITTWLNNRKSCPNCRARLHNSRLKPVLPIVRNMINRLLLRCENDGCTHSVQLEGYGGHIDVCEFSIVRCKNTECNESVIRKNLTGHENECRHRLTKCEKGCDLLLPLGKLHEHNCLSELKVKLQKVEDNLQTVTLKMTDIEKRVVELERRKRRRSERSSSVVSSIFARRGSPPLPWYSPSGPNRRRPEDNERNERLNQNNRTEDRRRNSPRERNNSVRRVRGPDTDQNDGNRRRSRSRSWSLFRSSTSRSRSRSPISDAYVSWDRSESSTSLSVASLLQELNSDSTVLNSTDDESFYSEMNRSFSSGSLTPDADFPVINLERVLSLEDVRNNATAGEEQEDVPSTPTGGNQPNNAASNQQPQIAAMNTSTEVDLLSVESENQEERYNNNVRRSPRLARRDPANNSSNSPDVTNGDSNGAIPILSRSAPSESSSDESNWAESAGTILYDSSTSEEEDDNLSSGSTYYSSTEQSHWTSLLQTYDSSDTDDTWALVSSNDDSS